MQAQRVVVRRRARDGLVVDAVAAQHVDRRGVGEDDEVRPATRREQRVVVGQEAVQARRASDDRVLEQRQRVVVDALPRLPEEADADDRLRARERIPVGHRDAVLLAAPAQTLLARRARRPAQHGAQALEQREVLGDVDGLVRHAVILAGR